MSMTVLGWRSGRTIRNVIVTGRDASDTGLGIAWPRTR